MDRRLRLMLALCAALGLLAGLLPRPACAEPPAPDLSAWIELKDRLWAEGLAAPAARACPVTDPGSRATDESIASWTRLAFESCRDGNWEIYLARADGSQPTRLTNHPAIDLEPRLNIGADRVAFVSERDGNSEVYSVNTDGSRLTRLTFTPADESSPCWSPDGSRLVFASKRDGDWDIYTMRADGSQQVPLIDWGLDDVEPAWSPDGSQIVWVRRMDEKEGVLWLMRSDGSNAHAITGRLRYVQHPAWSPGSTRICADLDYDNDYWNEVIEFDTQGQIRAERLDPTPGRAWWMYLVDVWMGAWSPHASQLVVTALHYAIEGDRIVLSHTSLEIPNGYSVSSSNCDMLPDWQTEDVYPPRVAFAALRHYQRAPERELPVAWVGQDVGPSGVRGYDVEVHDETTSAWTSWLQGTGDASANLHVEFGKTYFLRVRAFDWAGHTGAWVLARRDGTIPYAWSAGGRVFDARDQPVPYASLQVDPPPFDGETADVLGRYNLHTGSSGDHQITAAHAGYASPASLNLSDWQDPEGLDFALAPTDDCIREGGFESGSLDSWQSQGVFSPTVAPVFHSGQAGLLLSQPLALGLYPLPNPPAPVAPFPTRLTLDSQGNVYLLYGAMGASNYATYYVFRPASGAWSDWLLLEEGVTSAVPAVDASGAVHAVGVAMSGSDATGLSYRSKRRDGDWSTPVRIPGVQAGRTSLPQLAVDSRGRLHVIWHCQPCDGKVMHTIRSSSGVWTMQTPLPAGSTNLPHRPVVLARTGDDALHAVWYEGSMDESGSDALKLVYSRRPADGLWTAPLVLAASTELLWVREWPTLVADSANRLYLFWSTRGLTSGSPEQQGVYYRRSDDGGLHWTGAAHIDAWNDRWTHGSNAALAAAADARGRLHAVWEDRGLTCYSSSSDHGANWSRPQSIGPGFSASVVAADSAHNRLYVGGVGAIGELPALEDRAGDVRVEQRVSIPVAAHKPTLSFFYRLFKATAGGDRLQVLADGREVWSATAPVQVWTHAWVDVEAWRGRTFTLALNLRCETDGDRAEAYLDEVTLGSWLTPVIRSVSPAEIEAGAGVTLTVSGDNLLPGAVYLGEIPASGIQALDEHTLRVALPASLPPGIHDVRVVNVGGQEGVLVGAVRSGLAHYFPGVFR